MSLHTVRHEVAPSDAGRIDALIARLTVFSRARVRGLMEFGGVSLNGEPCTEAGEQVRAGDQVLVTYDPERRYREKPPERATSGFKVVYCDESLVVVEKEARILTVPTERGETNTLVHRLSAHLAKGRSSREKVSVVHRLDRETSGLLVFGRTPLVARALIAQFAARKPERVYAAIVAGRLSTPSGTIRSNLATDAALNQKSVDRGGELAITHYDVQGMTADTTSVLVRLETGRRNQIRVHFAEMGHPILGDARYSPSLASHARWPANRLALHAMTLGFRHPVSGKDLRFTSQLPAEFAAFSGSQRPAPRAPGSRDGAWREHRPS